MARFLISTRPFPFSTLPLAPPRPFFRPSIFSPPVRFFANPSPSRTLRVVTTRAGASTSSYIFAFSIPLSLILITVLTALKIGDNLDKKFLEELALNQAIMEEDEDYEDGSEISFEEKPTVPRTRNRPKREAEV
ncbi:uncharacterized protein LOC101209610 [Cucumis sativus]|uniref:High chlorophyll fluorescence 153 n=1 Tax=Cucumis sativus TaxID=3659 RepID=A0A0A0KTR1_CUCSA|nr:uncharacterized protein LOC101209610 [Cucumis sativus]KGN51096.1 hypothetical protein Csa_008146 [Cucumis sativus]